MLLAAIEAERVLAGGALQDVNGMLAEVRPTPAPSPQLPSARTPPAQQCQQQEEVLGAN